MRVAAVLRRSGDALTGWLAGRGHDAEDVRVLAPTWSGTLAELEECLTELGAEARDADA
jgi:hypothetical protein